MVGSEMGMSSSSSIANQLREWDFCVGGHKDLMAR